MLQGMAHSRAVSPRKRYTFWIDEHQAKALAAIQARDGILPSEQIRRALDAWVKRQGQTRRPPKEVPPWRSSHSKNGSTWRVVG